MCGGTCLAGSCSLAGTVLPCTEQGIRNAIAAGGEGRYTFDCDGPTTIVTEEWLVIDKDVILDGEGNITLDGNEEHPLLGVYPTEGGDPSTVELRGFKITGAEAFGIMNVGYAIYVFESALTLTDCTVSDNGGDGIVNQGATLTLLNSTVSENGFTNVANFDGNATLTVVNSTISGGQVGISNTRQMTISNSTVVSEDLAVRTPPPGDVPPPTSAFANTFTNTIVAGRCAGDVVNNVTSNGYNIESPGNTCGFDQTGDQSGVSAVLLDLQPLADNRGPTQTHAITTDSAAFNAGTCEVDEDQRGVTRPQGAACDVGAFELEVAP